jgi:hypothetical protein
MRQKRRRKEKERKKEGKEKTIEEEGRTAVPKDCTVRG